MNYYQLSLDNQVKKMWKKQKPCKILKRKKSYSKPVESIVVSILAKLRRIKTLECVYVKHKLFHILDEVISNKYFGTTQNRRRFYHLVNKITTQSRYECVYRSSLSKGYNIQAIPWLQQENLDEKESRQLLQNINIFLMRYVVKPLIKHFYHPLKTHKGYEIKFVKRSLWHSFQHNILNKLLKSKYIKLVPNQYLSRGGLKFFPKTTCDSLEYRPIIYSKGCDPATKDKFKRVSRNIQKLANSFSRIGGRSLYISWKKYCSVVEGQIVHGITLDIKDAFGYVDIKTLCSIIKQSNLSMSDKQFITNHIKCQYITFHKKLYRWNHGLLQGDRLSSSLCNLYMSDFEKNHLQEFNKPGCFLHRMVDDYLFCSLDKNDIEKFESIVRGEFQLNDSKTQKTDCSNSKLFYYGQVFDVDTKQVGKYYNFKKELPIRHKFKLWNIKKAIPEKSKHCIILKTMHFPFNNHYFKKLELNTTFNTEETVLKNYFEGMIFIAFKFDTAVMAIREFQQDIKDMPFILQILEKVVHEYSNIVFSKIKLVKGVHFSNNITFMLLKNIAYRAFILVLKRSTEFYKDIIDCIKKHDLYLKVESLGISPRMFSIFPKAFQNVCTSRKSLI